ncbi:MAG: transposase [Breznakibacter sp.]
MSGAVLDIGEDRDTESTRHLLDQIFTSYQFKSTITVSMDMRNPFMHSIENIAPISEIVYDMFHMVKYLNDAIDKVKRIEVKRNDTLKNCRYVC